jgi:UPF0271 protein
MHKIDINCDLGESYGHYKLGSDEEIIRFATSVNIACGYHAGDPAVMRKTVQLALTNGVAIGAHPGLPDLSGFGRRNMNISPQEAYDFTVYQIGALAGFVASEGGSMQHVKPHGALYNMAAQDLQLAEAIAEAVYKVDSGLRLVGLSGSRLIEAGRKAGLATVQEVFADRTYNRDGSLASRKEQDAVITDIEQAVSQALTMVTEGRVMTRQGDWIPVEAQTICIHGDGAHAVEFAGGIRAALSRHGVNVTNMFA